jgi:hypothetical protein
MIALRFDTKQFMKDMDNIIDYSTGFLDGVQLGKKEFLFNLGNSVTEYTSNFIDTMAKVDPQRLHHVYEWYRTGSPEARLFDIKYTVSNIGLSFTSRFRQSTTIKDGSKVPFLNKADIMERGQSVTISPKNAKVLSFDVNGEKIFTKGPVVVDNPGGDVQGQYAKVFDIFFSKYFSQSFLSTTGLSEYFSNPVVYKKNISRGRSQGRSHGISTGYKWVVNAKVNR